MGMRCGKQYEQSGGWGNLCSIIWDLHLGGKILIESGDGSGCRWARVVREVDHRGPAGKRRGAPSAPWACQPHLPPTLTIHCQPHPGALLSALTGIPIVPAVNYAT